MERNLKILSFGRNGPLQPKSAISHLITINNNFLNQLVKISARCCPAPLSSCPGQPWPGSGPAERLTRCLCSSSPSSTSSHCLITSGILVDHNDHSYLTISTIPELRFVATVTTGGRVKFVSAV